MASGEIPVDLEKAFAAAGERAAAKAGVLRHAWVFVWVNVFFLAVDAGASPESFWFMWPLSAWGLVLAVQAAHAWRPKKWNIVFKEEKP
ncbi:MAG: 2TM domain-containing protein [Deltaproteobacteria bacterium]|nr:2TM domain-containing protein [Deltaproteobacteria bacterium]